MMLKNTNVCFQLHDRNIKGPIFIPERERKSGVVIYGFTPAVNAPIHLFAPDVAAPPLDRHRRSGELLPVDGGTPRLLRRALRVSQKLKVS